MSVPSIITDRTAFNGPGVRLHRDLPPSRAGQVDAAWWPRTRSLTGELPGLLGALWDQGSKVTRVSYSLLAWDRPPRRISIAGRTIRLGGFTYGDPQLLQLFDAWGEERIDLLVIPPEIGETVAVRAAELRTENAGVESVGEILALAQLTAAGSLR